jgi:hypothetical protein
LVEEGLGDLDWTEQVEEGFEGLLLVVIEPAGCAAEACASDASVLEAVVGGGPVAEVVACGGEEGIVGVADEVGIVEEDVEDIFDSLEAGEVSACLSDDVEQFCRVHSFS